MCTILACVCVCVCVCFVRCVRVPGRLKFRFPRLEGEGNYVHVKVGDCFAVNVRSFGSATATRLEPLPLGSVIVSRTEEQRTVGRIHKGKTHKGGKGLVRSHSSC